MIKSHSCFSAITNITLNGPTIKESQNIGTIIFAYLPAKYHSLPKRKVNI